jgi:hypothetical protein
MVALGLLAASAGADPLTAPPDQLTQTQPLTAEQWDALRERVGLLDKIAHLPSLLPVVMKNRDALELTPEQVAAFQHWRRTDYQRMVDLMNDIIQRRIALSQATLDPAVSSAEILEKQAEIFELQRALIALRLSCRELIVSSFTPAQWDNLAFILEEYPRYAGLLQD